MEKMHWQSGIAGTEKMRRDMALGEDGCWLDPAPAEWFCRLESWCEPDQKTIPPHTPKASGIFKIPGTPGIIVRAAFVLFVIFVIISAFNQYRDSDKLPDFVKSTQTKEN